MFTQFFCGDEENGYVPVFGATSVTDGTLEQIGHVFAASLCHHGLGPGRLSTWVYEFVIGGMNVVTLPAEFQNINVYNEGLSCFCFFVLNDQLSPCRVI